MSEVDEFAAALDIDLSAEQRDALERELAWKNEHGEWRCPDIMSNGRSDIRCDRNEGHQGAHRGRFANGSARVWGRGSGR